MNQVNLSQLLDLGIALSREKNGEHLLELILTTAMGITNCDGGTLYILTEDFLEFKLMITKSLGILKGGQYGPIDLPPVHLNKDSACARSALDRTMFNVPDGYNSDDFDFSGPREYDSITGYHTVSMLVVPMEDDKGTIIGVLQLLNALDENGTAIPFGQECEQVIRSLASQAAISLTNMNYAVAVQNLMDSFVRVMSTAIDARTPYNANHTRGMIQVADHFIDWLNAQQDEWTFPPERKRLFLMSVWLHDIGKLTIPLEIMDKGSRLGGRLDTVLYRFQLISLLNRTAQLSGQITQEECLRRREELDEAAVLVREINCSYIAKPELMAAIAVLGQRCYGDERGERHPWLTGEELAALSIPRGTLTTQERAVMETHVTMTTRMLDEMHFPQEYACVPDWAGKHHEFLNGTGYPKHLQGAALPRESRLLTILDIFDALTQERPYSPPQPVEEALEVLNSMVESGQLDGEILLLFERSHAWEGLL